MLLFVVFRRKNILYIYNERHPVIEKSSKIQNPEKSKKSRADWYYFNREFIPTISLKKKKRF